MDSDDDSTTISGGAPLVSRSYQQQYRTGGVHHEVEGDDEYEGGGGQQQGYYQHGGEGGELGGREENVSALKEEIARLRDALSATSQGTIESNYFTQLKKNRELNVRFESERSKVLKLQNRIVQLEKEKLEFEQQNRKGVLLPSQKSPSKGGTATGSVVFGGLDETEVLQKQVQELTQRSERHNVQMMSLRKQNDELKKEVAKMKRVVAHEVGEDVMEKAMTAFNQQQQPGQEPSGGGLVGDDTASVVSGTTGLGAQTTVTNTTTMAPASTKASGGAVSSGWRGRAQQISLLKAKVKELERWKAESVCGTTIADPNDLGSPDDVTVVGSTVAPSSVARGPRSMAGTVRTTASGARDFDDVNRLGIERKESTRKMEVADLKKVLQQRDQDVEKEKTRADSLTARLQILERDNQHLKVCIARVVEKTENDDKLLQSYKEELDQKNREIRRVQTAQNTTRRGGAGGGGRTSSTTDHVVPVSYERELSSLRRTVADLQAALEKAEQKKIEQQQQQQQQQQRRGGGAKGSPTTGQPPTTSGGASVGPLEEINSLIVKDPHGALSNSLQLVDLQRRTLLALNGQLADYEVKTTKLLQGPAGSEVAANTREENLNLKERLKALTEMMDREIELHKQIASNVSVPTSGAPRSSAGPPPAFVDDEFADESTVSRPPPTASSTASVDSSSRGGTPSSARPPIAGRRKSATSGTRPPTTNPPAEENAPTGSPSSAEENYAKVAAMQGELQSMKKQYAELRNAYNAQQLSQNRVKTPAGSQAKE